MIKVTPVHLVGGNIHIQGHSILQGRHHLCVVLLQQINAADFMAVSKHEVWALTHCFTRLGNWVHLVAFVTLAFVVAFEVDTYLTAGLWVLAFVYVSTSLLVQELVARGALTLEADLPVFTYVRAAAIVYGTFIQSALLHRLIRPVFAVPDSVTHFAAIDTLPTLTHELQRPFTFVGSVDAAGLVAEIWTVVHFVTLFSAVNAGAVATLELIRTAGQHRTVCFIRLVLAVWISITFPVEMNALSAPAAKLSHGAVRFLRLCPAAAPLQRLVRLVSAVGVSVAAPRCWDAFGVVAAKLMWAAGAGGGGGALLLITAVPAVIITITYECWSHTHTVATLELFRRTSLGICGTLLLVCSIFTVSFSIAAP